MKKSVKTSLKTLGVGALMIPCAFGLTACGGNGQVQVDTSGNYQATTYSEASQYFDSVQEAGNLDFQGLKFTSIVDISGKLSQGGNVAEVKSTMTLNGAVSYGEEILASCDYTVHGKSSYLGTTVEENMNGNIWIKEGYVYTYLKNGDKEQKIKAEFDGVGDINPNDPTTSLPSAELIGGFLEDIAKLDDNELAIRVAENNETVKYEIKANSLETGEVTFYLVFKNDQLDQFQANFKYEMTGGLTATMTMNAVRTTEKVEVNETLVDILTQVTLKICSIKINK